MTIYFKESYRDEFYEFNADRAQAWLRGEGVKEALVYRTGDNVLVEVPMGIPTQLCEQAVAVGRRFAT